MAQSRYEFSRQPRFLPEMPYGEVTVPAPPSQESKPEISWFLVLTPPLVMMGVTLFIAMTSQSIFLMVSIATTIMTLIASLYGAVLQIRKYDHNKKIRERKYLQLIADIRADLAVSRDQQIKGLNESNPELPVCLQRIMKTDSKLWERTPAFDDFLSLRIGIGNAPFAIKVNYSDKPLTIENDHLADEPEKVAYDFQRIDHVPLCVNLVKSEICGLAGDRLYVSALLNVMMLQLITHHGYDDLRIVILMKEENVDQWEWAKQLPHVWSPDTRTRYMACGNVLSHQVLDEIHSELKGREMRQNSSGGNDVSAPRYLFIVEDTHLLENEGIAKYLYHPNGSMGVYTIFTAQSRANLPANCKAVITVSLKNGEYFDRPLNQKSTFIMDRLDSKSLEQAARYLAPLQIKSSASNFALPSKIELMDMLRIKKVEELNLLEQWERNKTYKGMKVPIGGAAGEELFFLDLHETGHGPHGLVAGTTGSGKSELLQTMVASFALHYHPHDLVFVLIDYKGGGMADVFKGLPHLVGTITNLDGNQTMRALVSIKSELKRRQRLFLQAGVNNIDKYQKLYYGTGKHGMTPIPHLVIIADEFAELKAEQPEFMKELVSTARVGRSLGVHLILATQKPAGVVDDQIWSNSKFKICLKVQDETDSRDVIKRPDAALIKEPGRAYIQVGNNEIFEMFQSAWSGAPYGPDDVSRKASTETQKIFKLSLHGKETQIYPLDEEKIEENETLSQLHAAVEYIQETAKNHGILPLDGPWLPGLNETTHLDELDTGSLEAAALMAPIVGWLDNPTDQIQTPLVIDFIQQGNLFIYGAAGSGKSVLLETLCLAMARQYSPSEANLYIMDFGGTSFKKFERLPHCGGVMFLEQESRINQFVLFMFRIIEERKQAFESSGVTSFKEYKAISKESMPGIIILIDNYFALSETYEDISEKILLLAREGSKFGIFMVATATNATLVRYKFAVNFNNVIALQLTEKGEYDSTVGRLEGLEPARIPGRGMIKHKPPLEIQIALPEYSQISQESILDTFEKAGRKQGTKARGIPEMPSHINAIAMNHSEVQEESVIGLNDQTLEPVKAKLIDTPFMVIAGEGQTGKTTLLTAWLKVLSDKLGDQVEIHAFDSPGMDLHPIFSWPNVRNIGVIEDMYEYGEELKSLIEERRAELREAKRKGVDLALVQRGWKQIVFAFDDFNEFTENGDYALKDLLSTLIKKDRELKIAIIAVADSAGFASNWDPLGKALRDCQTGILLGSLREQGVFNAKLPFGAYEKELYPGDGYHVSKTRYTGIRAISL